MESLDSLQRAVAAGADSRNHEILVLLQSPICEYARLRQMSTPAGDGIADYNYAMMACWEMGHELPCGGCWVCRQSRISWEK